MQAKIPIISMGLLLFIKLNCCISSELISKGSIEIKVELKGKIGTVQNWKFIQNGKGLLSLTKRKLDMKCEAPFPIKWNITGLIRDPEYVKIQPYKRRINPNGSFTFMGRLFIFFNPFEDMASCATISCQKHDDYQIEKSYDVFLPANSPFVNSGETINIEDSATIPCPTTSPEDPVILFELSTATGKYEKVENPPTYNPRIGFTFSNWIDGQFTCNTSENGVTIIAKINRSIIKGYDYTPKKQSLKSFTSDKIRLSCTSASKLSLLILTSGLVGVKINREDQTGRDNSTYTVQLQSNGSYTNGTATCLDTNGNSIWRWDIEFIEQPELYLDNFRGEVDCLTNHKHYSDRSVSSVRCIDSSHCNFMKHCFENPTSCNAKRQNIFSSNKNQSSRCWVRKYREGRPCASIPYSHLNGIIECRLNGLKKHWMFFISNEYLRRDISENVEPSELLRMDDASAIQYTNHTSTFFCKAAAFLFADSLTFQMEFQNGTRIFLDTEPVGQNSSRKVDESNILGELHIKLPLEAVAIHCLAPWLNSSEFYSTVKNFQSRHLQTPRMQSLNSTVKVVIPGTQRLNCSAVGEPQPAYYWSKDGQVLDIGEKIQLTTGRFGESLLEFLTADKSLRGIYNCRATNMVGSDTMVFTVEDIISGSVSNRNTTALGATIVIVLFILFTVLIILGYVVSRYLAQKRFIRGLTDREIDEFFEGNPAFTKSRNMTPENLDLLPYDRKFEINLEDIEFESSKVLGTGEFSIVVQGHWKPKNEDVAIKIAKPSADVTLFKSLLSEVKIMIYMEQHENILSLIGVCTRDIRNRNIHIVLEMCERGSLDVLLRKNRQTFVNLLNQNQQIDPSLLNGNSGSKISTLDLIRWSRDISKGMEYLAYKGIIHADLATRNVLVSQQWVAKISDFGLSKKLYECNNYVKKTKSPLPWRWMALESLHSLTFSKDSDVWSFGITVWEIFTLGDIPFPNETWDKEFVGRIDSGMRMGRPRFATSEIYSQLISCWDESPGLRPPFSNLRKYFTDLYAKHESGSRDNLYDNFSTGTNFTYLPEMQLSGLDNLPGMYANMLPGGGPHYANFDGSEAAIYSNVSE